MERIRRPKCDVALLSLAFCMTFVARAHANLNGDSNLRTVGVGATIQFPNASGAPEAEVSGFVARRGREGTVEFVRAGSQPYSFISNDQRSQFTASPQCWLRTDAPPSGGRNYVLESVVARTANLWVNEERLATRCDDPWLSADQTKQPCAPRRRSIRTYVTAWTFQSSNPDTRPVLLECVTPVDTAAPSLRSLSEQFGLTFRGASLTRPAMVPNQLQNGGPGALN